MFESRPLSGDFGADVTGIDLSGDVSAEEMADLRRLFHESQLMVIRDQDISPQRFRWFARHFGQPVPHILAHLRHKEVPEILPLSNIFVDGKPIGVYDGKYGPYVKWEKINATIPDTIDPAGLTLAQAVDLIDERAAKKGKPVKKKAAAKKKPAPKKTAATKKKSGAKTASGKS